MRSGWINSKSNSETRNENKMPKDTQEGEKYPWARIGFGYSIVTM